MSDLETPCALWAGATHEGYPMLGTRRVHRMMYEASRGPIAPGAVVHHLCERKLCVEPAHLVTMSPADHMRLHRAWERSHEVSRARETCVHGHPRDGRRTIHGVEHRYCTTCHKADCKRRYYARKAMQTASFGAASEADGTVPETINGEATDAA